MAHPVTAVFSLNLFIALLSLSLYSIHLTVAMTVARDGLTDVIRIDPNTGVWFLLDYDKTTTSVKIPYDVDHELTQHNKLCLEIHEFDIISGVQRGEVLSWTCLNILSDAKFKSITIFNLKASSYQIYHELRREDDLKYDVHRRRNQHGNKNLHLFHVVQLGGRRGEGVGEGVWEGVGGIWNLFQS